MNILELAFNFMSVEGGSQWPSGFVILSQAVTSVWV